jgi:hypothetical protein
MSRARKRAALTLVTFVVAAWGGSLVLAGPSVGAASATASGVAHVAAGGTWHGTAEGIRVDFGHESSGDVDSSSESDYQVELSFSFSVSPSGEVSGGGSGYYTDANWHLYGVNGDNGSFDCNPPITADAFEVDVSGHAAGDQATVSLSMPDATETNEDYDCGADYTGYATTTHDMSDSLNLVGGDDLQISLSTATVLSLQKPTNSGSGDDTESDQSIWSFTFTPPGDQNTGQGDGNSSSTSPTPCTNSLTQVVAKPAQTTVGKPVTARFNVSHSTHASLIVSPPGGARTTVASLIVPAGRNTLVWSGWIGTHLAARGDYRLTVRSAACGSTRTQAVAVTIH